MWWVSIFALPPQRGIQFGIKLPHFRQRSKSFYTLSMPLVLEPGVLGATDSVWGRKQAWKLRSWSKPQASLVSQPLSVHNTLQMTSAMLETINAFFVTLKNQLLFQHTALIDIIQMFCSCFHHNKCSIHSVNVFMFVFSFVHYLLPSCPLPPPVTSLSLLSTSSLTRTALNCFQSYWMEIFPTTSMLFTEYSCY